MAEPFLPNGSDKKSASNPMRISLEEALPEVKTAPRAEARPGGRARKPDNEQSAGRAPNPRKPAKLKPKSFKEFKKESM
jgi:hypothetical protein